MEEPAKSVFLNENASPIQKKTVYLLLLDLVLPLLWIIPRDVLKHIDRTYPQGFQRLYQKFVWLNENTRKFTEGSKNAVDRAIAQITALDHDWRKH